MIFSLSEEAAEYSYRVESYEIVSSTNELAADFAKNGDEGHLWIAAEEQTGGRGRRGRIWRSPKGNLYASLLLSDNLTAEQTANLGFVAGVALWDALCSLTSADIMHKLGIKLKWPNDIISNGAKLAGILPEFISFPAKTKAAAEILQTASIVGIGVNVTAAPDFCACSENQTQAAAPLYPVSSLNALGIKCAAPAVFKALSRAWAENYILWDKGRGMAAICEKWLAHAAYKGKLLHIIQNKRQIEGIFETIDESGRLVLAQKSGERILISAGDVFFGDAASQQMPQD